MLLGNNMHVMTQSLKEGDGPHLPHGLSFVNSYTEVTTGSKQVSVVVKNLMAIPITITKGIKVTQAVAANAVPQVEVAPKHWRCKVSSTLGCQLNGGERCSSSN